MHATELQAKELRAAVAAVKASPRGFRMDTWVNECGTVCCLAGHVARNNTTQSGWQALVNQELTSDVEYPLRDMARHVLGLSVEAAEALFLVEQWPAELTLDDEGRPSVNPTPEQLEVRVEHWIRTGE